MPKITFTKNFPTIEVADGENLMQALLNGGRPVGSSCGGEGVCTKCLIQIIDGKENLSFPNERELKIMAENLLANDLRVSCQCKIHGDICLDIDYW